MKTENELKKLKDYFYNNTLAHAYLIVTNNVEDCMKDLLTLLKEINCKEKYKDNCVKCNICNLINKNSLPSIQIIEPIGTVIKKEQILNLKYLFSTSSQLSDNNIYIIKNAEKLNKESTNSMLKFLEEPNDNVIGFFVTTEKNNMLDTIISRCEVINNLYETSNYYDVIGINVDKYDQYIKLLKSYLKDVETDKNKSILVNKEQIVNEYHERNDIIDIVKLIFDIYSNALKLKYGLEESKYSGFDYIINQDSACLEKKLDVLSEILKKLNYNVSTELILDEFVIEVARINDKYIWSNVPR